LKGTDWCATEVIDTHGLICAGGKLPENRQVFQTGFISWHNQHLKRPRIQIIAPRSSKNGHTLFSIIDYFKVRYVSTVYRARRRRKPPPCHDSKAGSWNMPFLHFATTLGPGQDKSAPSAPISGASWFVVSCGVRLSEVGLSGFRKPQVRFLSYQSNSLNFRAQQGYQRRLESAALHQTSLARAGGSSGEAYPY